MTQVLSSSSLALQNGRQTLTNFQNATSESRGSSSVSAGNISILKRKKRFIMFQNNERMQGILK